MLQKSAAEVLIDKLQEWGIKRCYGIPGDSINTIMDVIRRRKEITFIQVRHEETGAFMATAEAKSTGNSSEC